jgi:hypothetical protein
MSKDYASDKIDSVEFEAENRKLNDKKGSNSFNTALNSSADNFYRHDAYAENRYKKSNMFKVRPKGWLIMDSWNNKAFPMSVFEIDTMKFNTSKLGDEFHRKFGGNKRDLFLPWHWVVELVDEKPYVIQTRPPFYYSGIPGYKNYYTIMIIGNSNVDIYPGLFYKAIAHQIINPWHAIPSVRVPNSKEDFVLWTGKNFDFNNLLKELF